MIKITKTGRSELSDMTGLTWYFFGPPKSGKTTNSAKWSPQGSAGTLLIDTDKGSDFLNDQDHIPVTSLMPPFDDDGKEIEPEKRGAIHRMGEHKGEPKPVYSMSELITELFNKSIPPLYDTIVIDTIDMVYEWSEQRIKSKYQVNDISDLGYGKGWGESRDIVIEIVETLQNFCKSNLMNLVLISHSKETTVTDNKVQLSPELPKGLSKKLTAMSDAIGVASFDKESGKPMLSFESYDERAVGSRIPELHNNVYEFDYHKVINNIKKEPVEEKPQVSTTNNHVNNTELINA